MKKQKQFKEVIFEVGCVKWGVCVCRGMGIKQVNKKTQTQF